MTPGPLEDLASHLPGISLAAGLRTHWKNAMREAERPTRGPGPSLGRHDRASLKVSGGRCSEPDILRGCSQQDFLIDGMCVRKGGLRAEESCPPRCHALTPGTSDCVTLHSQRTLQDLAMGRVSCAIWKGPKESRGPYKWKRKARGSEAEVREMRGWL